MDKAYHWWTFAKLPLIPLYDTIHPYEDSPHWMAMCPGPGFKCGVFLACLKSYKPKLSIWKPYLTNENWHTQTSNACQVSKTGFREQFICLKENPIGNFWWPGFHHICKSRRPFVWQAQILCKDMHVAD